MSDYRDNLLSEMAKEYHQAKEAAGAEKNPAIDEFVSFCHKRLIEKNFVSYAIDAGGMYLVFESGEQLYIFPSGEDLPDTNEVGASVSTFSARESELKKYYPQDHSSVPVGGPPKR